MAMVVIKISTVVEISFCEALMRMIFVGYETLMIAAIEMISVRAFREVLSAHSTLMCTGVHIAATVHSTVVRDGVHVPAAHASCVSHRTHATGMSHCATAHVATTVAASTSSATTAVTDESNATVWTAYNGKASRVGRTLQ